MVSLSDFSSLSGSVGRRLILKSELSSEYWKLSSTVASSVSTDSTVSVSQPARHRLSCLLDVFSFFFYLVVEVSAQRSCSSEEPDLLFVSHVRDVDLSR